MDCLDLAMVVATHMVDVDDSVIDNEHHKYECSPQQSYKVEAINICEKLIIKSCEHQNFQSLACHSSFVSIRVKMGQYEHTTSCLEKVTLLRYELIIIFTRKILELEQEAQGEQ